MYMVLTNHETTITVRCNNDLKDKAEELANEKGQSLVEWIRRAIKEKIERETSGVSDAELEATVRKVLLKMKQEENQKQ